MNQISKTKRRKILSLICACILLVCSVIVVGISSKATDEIVVTAEITEKNLDYRAMIHMAFAIELHDDAPEGIPGIAIWNDGMKSYNPDNAIYTRFDKSTSKEGKEFYLGMPIAATDLKKPYRVAVVIKTQNGIVVSSNPELYSVTDYANERLSDLAAAYEENRALTEKQVNQKNLYEKLLVLAGLPNNAFDELKPYVYTEASILPLKGGAGGAVAIVHDDGDINTMQFLDKMLIDNGLVADVALILDKVYDKNSASVKTDSLNAFKEYINNGRWSIINHSGTHSWWGEMNGNAPYLDANGNTVDNQEKLTYEVVTSQQKLRELFPGQRVLTYAYPGFSTVESQLGDVNDSEMLKKYIYSPAARELIMKHHISARNSRADGSLKATNKSAEWDWVKGWFLTPDRITTWLDGELNAAAASGGVIIASLHALTTDPDQPAKDGGYSLLNTYMETFCRKVSERVNSDDLWNAHYEDIALYVREAQDAFVEAIYDEANEKITVSLSDSLDDSVYNYELTVRVKIPDNWKAVTVNYNGKKTIATAKIVDRNNVVDIEVAPDNGNAVITPELTTDNDSLVSNFGITLDNGAKLDANYFPGFVRKAVTFTIDDGNISGDTAFLNIVRPAGILGTFNLINTTDISAEAYRTLYSGYEVANHHRLHCLPILDGFDFDSIEKKDEIFNSSTADTDYVYKTSTEGLYYVDYHHIDPSYNFAYWHPIATNETYTSYIDITKESIESVFGEDTVVGFAYPHGKLSTHIKQYLQDNDYLYARKTGSIKNSTNFDMPTDRFEWTYNADSSCLNDVMAQFDAYADDGKLKLFAFGVHAIDFNGKWDVLEEFASTYGGRPDDFYYATNKDIFEYEDALKALKYENGKLINASKIDLYVTIDNVKTIIPANSIYTISDKSISAN